MSTSDTILRLHIGYLCSYGKLCIVDSPLLLDVKLLFCVCENLSGVLSCFWVLWRTGFVSVLVWDSSISYLQLSINQPLSFCFLLLPLFCGSGFLQGGGLGDGGDIEKRDKKVWVSRLPSTFNCSSFCLWCFCWAPRTPAEHCRTNPPQYRLVGKAVGSLIKADKIKRSPGICFSLE